MSSDSASAALRIEADDLARVAVRALLAEHLADMNAISPPGSAHALDIDALRAPGVSFWSVWDGDALVGCGALKELATDHGEVKSMRTPAGRRRQGAGRAVLAHIVAVARTRGYCRLSLESGASEPFRAAHRLYESAGFVRCGPFATYTDDPNSVFYTLDL